MTERVLVTPRSMTSAPPASLSRLRGHGAEVILGPSGRQPSREELRGLLPGVTAWIVGVETVDEEILRLAPNLHTLSRNGVGMDAIDVDAAQRRGIRVMNTPAANADGVAELSIALLLNLLRGVSDAANEMRAHRWTRGAGRELKGGTLGIVGLGAIGSRVAGIAAGFGAAVVGFDPWVRPEVARRTRMVSLDELLRESDFVSLHTPGPSDGTAILGIGQLEVMRRGAVLVNTARWGVADPSGVLDALESGRLGGYAIDSFAQEPPLHHPLLTHPRVLATPHIGAFTRESAQRAADAAIDNVIEALKVRQVDAHS